MNEADAQPVEGSIPISTAGPLSVHHLLLHLASDHRVTVHHDVAKIDHGAIAAAALEIWRTSPSNDSARWCWYLLRQGRVVEEAPHDPYRLRPYDDIVLTVTRSTLPDRDSVATFRKALRVAGATCTLSRLAAVRVPERERVDA